MALTRQLVDRLARDPGITDPLSVYSREYRPGSNQAVLRTWRISVKRISPGNNSVEIGYSEGYDTGGKTTPSTAEELAKALPYYYLEGDYKSLRHAYDTRNLPKPTEIHNCGECPARKLRSQLGQGAVCGGRRKE